MVNKIYLYNTGSYAKERLITMLAADRIGCNPDFIDELKHTIKNELDKYINVNEDDIDIHFKENSLIAYIPLTTGNSSSSFKNTNKHEYITIGQGLVNYETIEERPAELKTIQS